MNRKQLMIEASRFRDGSERKRFYSDQLITIVIGLALAALCLL